MPSLSKGASLPSAAALKRRACDEALSVCRGGHALGQRPKHDLSKPSYTRVVA